jgi:hypothetical protein
MTIIASSSIKGLDSPIILVCFAPVFAAKASMAAIPAWAGDTPIACSGV